MNGRPSLPWGQIVLGALLLLAATPPAWGALAPVLVVPGLAVHYALATSARRPVLACYWLGALHIGALSWSLRHVALGGWLAVALLGGLYHALVAVATRRLARFGAAGFAVAIAGACWLRAEMPGIGYPHGQPCHDLWPWPWLLGAVRLGGEPLANALLAGLAAAVVRAARGWRTAVPEPRRTRRQLVLWSLLCGAVTIGAAPVPESARRDTVAIAAIEPGLHPLDAYADVPRGDRATYARRWAELFRQRLLEPTQALAGAADGSVPELVLWPESSVRDAGAWTAQGEPVFDALEGVLQLRAGVQVCLGAEFERDGRATPAAVLLDARGRYVAHHEKQRLVPGGETLPLLESLPDSVAGPVRAWLQTAVGVPAALPGRARPPLSVPARGDRAAVPFAALVCYDNAFPDVVAGAVAAGARFLAVLSNEAWYRGGAELDQLVAITVVRAIACAVPIVRCTTDGRSVAVDRDGRILQELPRASAPTPAARVLSVDLPLGHGRLPPMASLHGWLGWAFAAAVSLCGLQALFLGARLLCPDRPTARGGGPTPDAARGGS